MKGRDEVQDSGMVYVEEAKLVNIQSGVCIVFWACNYNAVYRSGRSCIEENNPPISVALHISLTRD